MKNKEQKEYDLKNIKYNLLKHMKNIPEINECEYIFIDELSLSCYKNPFLENKIIITQNKFKEYMMFETKDIQDNGQIKNMTKIDSQIVDLLILNDFEKIPDNIDKIIDDDTIIYKNLGNNIIYIEDIRKNFHILITENERIVINGRGIRTYIKQYEKINT